MPNLSELVGNRAAVALTVRDADTAIALGSGDVAVLGTPRVLALAEQACVLLLADVLPSAWTTVGARVTLDHLAPTEVGGTVVAEAQLTAVDGRTLDFAITVSQPSPTDPGVAVDVARITHRRALVRRSRFPT